jgi:Cu2+-exporting ATPase/Cu+-exporting ATPase
MAYTWKGDENNQEDTKIFCCRGCLQVYELACELGLDVSHYDNVRNHVRDRCQKNRGFNGYAADISVDGMWCPSCTLLIETALLRKSGILNAEVNCISGSARIHCDPSLVTEAG